MTVAADPEEGKQEEIENEEPLDSEEEEEESEDLQALLDAEKEDEENEEPFDSEEEEEEIEILDDLLQELREKSGVFFAKLPRETIFNNIFPRIPLKSLSQCRWVCKTWYRLIRHPRFAQIQYEMAIQNRYSPCLVFSDYSLNCCHEFQFIDHQFFDNHLQTSVVECFHLNGPDWYPQIIGFVNGLLCLGEDHSRTQNSTKYVVYNPITGEQTELPRCSCIFMDIDFAAFGYDSATNEYKVIRIRNDQYGAEVFTLGTTRWRRIQGHVPTITNNCPYSLLVNGNLHWISYEPDEPLAIVAFNVASEKFHKFESPPFFMPEFNVKKIRLQVIEEQLCFIFEKTLDQFEIWVMKDYDMQGSWTKEYNFDAQVTKCLLYGFDYSRVAYYNVIKLVNGEFLVQYGPNDIAYYDTEQQSCRPIILQTPNDCYYLFLVFLVGSLFSPKNVGRLAMSTQMRITEHEKEEESVKDEEGEEIDLRVLQEMSGELFSKLPSDIILHILCRIPIKSLSSQCRWVCRTWFNLICHPRFAEIHYEWEIQNCCSPCVVLHDSGGNFGLVDHQVFDNLETSAPVHYLEFLREPEFVERLEVIGSVNGLLCFSEEFYRCSYPVFYYVCNPITGENLSLPRASELLRVTACGFGFDSITNEYKVCRFYYDRKGGEVFTLGSSRWRWIENSLPRSTYGRGKHVNNHLHWTSRGHGESFTIVAFDMAAEEIHEIGPPPLLGLDNVVLG
ncbi:hypothetical protein IFM89_012325 [Coptis chinensis]|uniref:F-box domain-containing protein n=1 Tax=Coptis chinensis TaxID=261450 RepID=A0A835I0C3_9MAGN|nr:hypothetical protein IFM89_012325 [Coptis chinensis]